MPTTLRDEAKSFSITSVFNIMTKLKQKPERRLKDRFFGFTVNNKLKQIPVYLSMKCETDFLGFYCMKEQRNTQVTGMTSLRTAFKEKWKGLALQLLCHMKNTLMLSSHAI